MTDKIDIQKYMQVVSPAHLRFVYLAGPYRGKDAMAHDWTVACEIKDNVNNARRWAIKCARTGIPYVCPHLNSESMELLAPDVPPSFWLNMDLAILWYAWGILMLPDWRDSKGARTEMEFAQERGIPIYTTSKWDNLVTDYQNHLEGIYAVRKRE